VHRSAEKFGAVSGEGRTDGIIPPISQHPTRHFSPHNRQIGSRFDQVVIPLLTGTSSKTGCDVTHSKQSIRKFLAGAGTRFRLLQFRAKFIPQRSAQRKKESASRDASEQGKIPLNAQKEKEPL
jgi:hypothetical protein